MHELLSLRARGLGLPLLVCAWVQPVSGAGEGGPLPVTTRSVAANRIAETPDYAHEWGGAGSWLDFGLESRTRYERRWHDYSYPGLISDNALVTRNLLFLGVREGLDPLRLGLELEDSRRFFSDRIDLPAIENELEVLQAYLQLYFEAVAGAPLRLSFGRMAFDWVDRRLIARNRNRNAISAFDGLRLRLGEETGPWELEAIATRPVDRYIEDFDESSDHARLYGLAGFWRGWSPHVVLEPYWLWLDQEDLRGLLPVRRDLHTLGLHAYGCWGRQLAWDYDLSVAGQWGETLGERHRAWAAHAEVGRTFATAWKPRLALWLNYASGDDAGGDGRNERFDPLYGATFALYGYSGYFAWQNLVNPALHLSFQPAGKLRCELMHRAVWLASESDAWVRGLRLDRSGGSGAFVGQETDVRVVWQVAENFDLDLCYAHFFPGGFAEETGAAPQSDLVQIAATLRF